MRISATPPPEPPPLPRKLLDRIGPVAIIAVIVLLAVAAGQLALGALGVALVVCLERARRRSSQDELERAKRDGRRGAAATLLALTEEAESPPGASQG